MGENKEKEYVLAMYDIRGKQNYIYKSRKMKEIVGASLIIRDCFVDYLFPAAREVSERGIYSYRVIEPEKNEGKPKEGSFRYKKELTENDLVFSQKGFEDHLQEGYIGEVIYDGVGNFFVLYKDLGTYREVNEKFYVKLLKKTYSLRVLTSYKKGVNFDDYEKDRKNLYAIHRENEHRECVQSPVNALPIVQVDPQTCMPLAETLDMDQAQGRKDKKVSKESKAKYDKYRDGVDKNTEGARILDEMITEKGVDSHLAVIYIDGNSMGAKVQRETEKCKSYADSVEALRRFSDRIQKEYIDGPMQAIDDEFEKEEEEDAEKHAKNKKDANGNPITRLRRRFVVYAGDEITFVCNAHDAYRIVNTYFNTLTKDNANRDEKEKNSSCAGVAIFHSHAPYADAYRIAEECCETGKQRMKKKKIINACYLDFHYCQGAVGTSLEDIREHEGTTEMCRPWLLDVAEDVAKKSEEDAKKPEDAAKKSAEDEKSPTKDEIDEMAALLNQIARTNGKTLLFAAKDGREAFETEMLRIRAHATEKEENVKRQINKVLGVEKSSENKADSETTERNRKLIYRMMLIYDLWFRQGMQKKTGNMQEETEGGEQA